MKSNVSVSKTKLPKKVFCIYQHSVSLLFFLEDCNMGVLWGNLPIKGPIRVMRDRKQTYKLGITAKDRRKLWSFFALHFSFPVTSKLHFHKTVKTTVEVGFYKRVWERKEEIEGVMEKGRQTEKVGDGGFSPLCTWVISPCLICSDRLPSMLWAALNCCRKHTHARAHPHALSHSYQMRLHSWTHIKTIMHINVFHNKTRISLAG